MVKLYKLTDENGRTHGATQWAEGVSHSGTGEGELCGPGWIHAYESPELAAFLHPIHADFAKPRLWEAEGDVALTDGGLKVGCRTLTVVREISMLEPTTDQRMNFAILCAKAVTKDKKWNAWADGWLSGKDRSAEAKAAARAAARAAAWTAKWAAEAAEAAKAAKVAAAWTAKWAAAAETGASLDLAALAREAMRPLEGDRRPRT